MSIQPRRSSHAGRTASPSAARHLFTATLALPLLASLPLGCSGVNTSWASVDRFDVPGELTAQLQLDDTLGVSLDLTSADILVTQSADQPSGSLNVRARFDALDEFERDAAIILTEPAEDGGTLIDVRNPERPRNKQKLLVTSIEITAPASLGPVTLETIAGGIVFRGLARTDINPARPSRFDTSSGSITVDGHTGDLIADSIAGSIDLANTTGDIRADTASGDITVADARRSLLLDTISGTVRAGLATGHTGEVDIESTSGDLTLTGLRGDADLDTVSGSIRITLAPDANGLTGWLLADTVSGDIRSVLPTAEPLNAAFTINAETTSGDITVER